MLTIIKQINVLLLNKIVHIILSKSNIYLLIAAIDSRIIYLEQYKILEKTADYDDVSTDIDKLKRIRKILY